MMPSCVLFSPVCLCASDQKANIDEKAIRFPDPPELVLALAKAKVNNQDMLGFVLL